VVTQVSADAHEKPEPSHRAIKSAQEAAYCTSFDLSIAYLQSQSRQLRLVAGMKVNAAIHLGMRRVLEYRRSRMRQGGSADSAGLLNMAAMSQKRTSAIIQHCPVAFLGLTYRS
jgi:hypothetical protein